MSNIAMKSIKKRGESVGFSHLLCFNIRNKFKRNFILIFISNIKSLKFKGKERKRKKGGKKYTIFTSKSMLIY